MRKISKFIVGAFVCLTTVSIIMFFSLYMALIIADTNPPIHSNPHLHIWGPNGRGDPINLRYLE